MIQVESGHESGGVLSSNAGPVWFRASDFGIWARKQGGPSVEQGWSMFHILPSWSGGSELGEKCRGEGKVNRIQIYRIQTRKDAADILTSCAHSTAYIYFWFHVSVSHAPCPTHTKLIQTAERLSSSCPLASPTTPWPATTTIRNPSYGARTEARWSKT